MNEQEMKELRERTPDKTPDKPNEGARSEMMSPLLRQPSIRVKDRMSVRMTIQDLNNQNRMTFGRSRNASSFNDFTAALLNIPMENDDCVIFPWDEETKEFVIEDESKINSIENVSRDDIDAVFARLKQSEYFDLYANMHYKLMSPFVLVLIVIIVFLLFFQDSFSFKKNKNAVVAVFLGVFGILLIMIILVSIFWARYLKRRLAAREADFSKILNELNSEVFCDKDVFWKCGKLGTYIQLDLNYRFKNLDEPKSRNGSNSVKNKISISMNIDQTTMLAKLLDQTRMSTK